MNFTHIDAVGSLTDPGILLATVFSSALLAFLTIKILSLLLGLAGAQDRVAKVVMILFISSAYFAIAFLQIWLATILHKEFYDIGPAAEFGLSVPIFPVWFVGAFSDIIYVAVRVFRRTQQEAKSRTPSQWAQAGSNHLPAPEGMEVDRRGASKLIRRHKVRGERSEILICA